MKRICIDLDGCVVQYDFPKIVKNFFGVDLPPAAIYAYDLADVLGVSPTLINTMFREQVYGKPTFLNGALETLRDWESEGHELVIYSNRLKYMSYYELIQWLMAGGIPFHWVDDGQGEFDVHIDDSPAKLMATNSTTKLLFNQSWNEKCLNIQGRLERVYDWAEVKAKVSAL